MADGSRCSSTGWTFPKPARKKTQRCVAASIALTIWVIVASAWWKALCTYLKSAVSTAAEMNPRPALVTKKASRFPVNKFSNCRLALW